MKKAKKLGLTMLLFLNIAAVFVAPAEAQQTTVILVRHAERVDASTDALNEAGKARARRLVDLLSAAGITAVYSTPFVRTRDTAQPLAQSLGLSLIETAAPAGASFAQSVAQQVLRDHKGRTVLVVGHSNTTPEVIKALGAPAVPAIPDGEYDNLYVVQVDANGKATLIRAKY